jgi:hypothetical protein
LAGSLGSRAKVKLNPPWSNQPKSSLARFKTLTV